MTRLGRQRTLTLGAIQGLSRSWGSGCDGCWRVPVAGGLETLPETGAERAVVNSTADLEQPVGAVSGPTHLLRFVHPAVHEEIGRASVSDVPTRCPARCRSA